MLRVAEDVDRASRLDDLAAMHHDEVLGALGGETQVVVMKITAVLRSAVSFSRWSRIVFCTVTSSALVGSSAMSSFG